MHDLADSSTTQAAPADLADALARLAASRAQMLERARSGELTPEALREAAETEASLTLALRPMPADPAGHIRAAHAHARPYLERLPRHDPTRAVVADAEHTYRPRTILRRVLDHALDHLNQVEQWLCWQEHGSVPTPTDGWATSATTLDEDQLPVSAADLEAWLWRLDLANVLLAGRAERLSDAQLDWLPPDGGWSLRRALHHVASAEIYYAVWLDEPLPDDAGARYAEASQRLMRALEERARVPLAGDHALFAGERAVTAADVVREALAAERTLLGDAGESAETNVR